MEAPWLPVLLSRWDEKKESKKWAEENTTWDFLEIETQGNPSALVSQGCVASHPEFLAVCPYRPSYSMAAYFFKVSWGISLHLAKMKSSIMHMGWPSLPSCCHIMVARSKSHVPSPLKNMGLYEGLTPGCRDHGAIVEFCASHQALLLP